MEEALTKYRPTYWDCGGNNSESKKSEDEFNSNNCISGPVCRSCCQTCKWSVIIV